jgi:hypothetical protein
MEDNSRRISIWIAGALLSVQAFLDPSVAGATPAQEPEQGSPADELVVALEEVAGADAENYRQDQQATVAGIHCGGDLIGSSRSRNPFHAEELLQEALDKALQDPRCKDGVDLVINRSPCSIERCGTVLIDAARRLRQADIGFRVVVTGLYHAGSSTGRPAGQQALSLQDMWTAVDWINRMMDAGSQVMVGRRGGHPGTGGQELLEALQYVIEARALLSTGDVTGSAGPLPALVAASATGADATGAGAPGGIDFSSLELRYLADSSEGDGLRYAFSADQGGERSAPAGEGLRVADLQSDAFFVWLSLPTSSFWVNLNPDEPERIIDAELGRTEVGRILLEADLQMKRTVGQLIHPDTTLGAQLWNGLGRGSDGQTCFSFRQWIVPGEAVVREDQDGLYILDAPLEVKLESEYLAAQGAANLPGCQAQDPTVAERNEALFSSLILPEIQRAVNEAPEYADLRRVYLSRVAAEWYRQRSLQHATTYQDLVDGGDIDPWTSKQPWSPRDVFDRYVQSYTEGEFDITRETRQGDWIETNTYVYGGVDFSSVLFDRVASSEFRATWPDLPDLVGHSFSEPTVDAALSDVWLGSEATEATGATESPSRDDTAVARPASRPDRRPGPGGQGVPAVAAVVVVTAIFTTRRVVRRAARRS